MATAIEQIRSLIQDKPLFQSDSVVADGTEKVVQVQYFPVVGSTVTVTPSGGPHTIEEQNGVITFAAAPAAGTYAITYFHVLLLDADIQNFIDIEGVDTDVRLAAADALDAIASSQALILKKIKLLDLDTDGPAVAKALREHARELRKQVLAPEYEESYFEIVEQIYDVHGWEEKILKDALRET